MGASHSGHKHDASEGSEIVSWIKTLKLDLASVPEGEEIFPDSICPTCKHFSTHLEGGSWEYGERDYLAWDCYAKDEEGEDLHYNNVIDDYFITECPYFVKKEQP